MTSLELTWLGHASFRFDTPAGKRIYVDPFLHGNPKCPESELEPERVDVIALTHGHGDHVGDTLALSKKFSPEIVALLDERQAARKAKDFKRSDAIRDELKAKGWAIEDTPKGARLKKL